MLPTHKLIEIWVQVSKKPNCKANIPVSEHLRFFMLGRLSSSSAVVSTLYMIYTIQYKSIGWDTDLFVLRIGPKSENFLNLKRLIKHDFCLKQVLRHFKDKTRLKCFDKTGPLLMLFFESMKIMSHSLV